MRKPDAEAFDHVVGAMGVPASRIVFFDDLAENIKGARARGLKAGGRDNGGAGPRADYSPTYYAAFLIDPDGNNVEAVYHGEAKRSAASVTINFSM